MARGSTSSGVFIHDRKVPARKNPTNPTATPLSTLSSMEVCTPSLVCLKSPAPWYRATTTFAPTDSPRNRFTSRLISAPGAPTAASAASPSNLPTTITSAALKVSCNTLDRISGTAKVSSFGITGPLSMSSSNPRRRLWWMWMWCRCMGDLRFVL